MNDNMKNTETKKLYSLIWAMRDELQRLTLEIRALEELVRGGKSGG